MRLEALVPKLQLGNRRIKPERRILTSEVFSIRTSEYPNVLNIRSQAGAWERESGYVSTVFGSTESTHPPII
jgi:hypothetical protein